MKMELPMYKGEKNLQGPMGGKKKDVQPFWPVLLPLPEDKPSQLPRFTFNANDSWKKVEVERLKVSWYQNSCAVQGMDVSSITVFY
jgi:hypothetical protein